jgi:Maltose acetyltransferase
MSTDPVENKARMRRGELYHAFTPELIAERRRCELAFIRFNEAGDVNRRRRVQMWRE